MGKQEVTQDIGIVDGFSSLEPCLFYRSATQMVITFGKGVHLFTHDPSLGEFLLTKENVRIPDKPKKIYSVNEGNSIYWHGISINFIECCVVVY